MILRTRAWLGTLLVLGLLAPSSGAALDWLHYEPYPELDGKIVHEVLVFGNNHTNSIVVRREMRLTEGSIFRSEDLWRDWERIVDLGLFANVEVEAVESGEGALVVVSVYERPRWLAAPIVDYDLEDGSVTAGFRVHLRNVNGLNQQLRTKIIYGGRDSFTLNWSTPWIGSVRQSLSLDLGVDLPGNHTDELRTSRLALSTTRFLGDFKKVRRGITPFVGLELLRRDGNAPAGKVNQLAPSLGLGYFRDSRNVRIDPRRGSLLSASGEYAVGWVTDDLSYLRSILDGRAFRSFGAFVIAGRARAVLSRGEVPPYRKVGIGGPGSIRGQVDTVDFGDNIGATSLEVRFPILGKRRFTLPIPLAPKRVRNFDLRIDGVLFGDAGSAWNDTPELRTARIFRGVGFGLRVFLPVLELARLEVAFDENGRPTFYFREGNLI
jgi:outer membrane protein assembly factor BamA